MTSFLTVISQEKKKMFIYILSSFTLHIYISPWEHKILIFIFYFLNKPPLHYSRPSLNVLLLPCQTQMNLLRWWHDKGTAAVSNIEFYSVVLKIRRSLLCWIPAEMLESNGSLKQQVMNSVWHSKSTPFEAESHYCCQAWQGLSC